MTTFSSEEKQEKDQLNHNPGTAQQPYIDTVTPSAATPSLRVSVLIVVMLMIFVFCVVVGTYFGLPDKSDSSNQTSTSQDREGEFEDKKDLESITVKARMDAEYVQKKARAYHVIKGRYASFTELMSSDPDVPEAHIETEQLREKLSTEVPTAQTPEMIQYKLCTSGGGAVVYYDSLTRKTVPISFGDGCES